MLMAVDVGNTHITLGIFDGELLIFYNRFSTDSKRTEDEFAAMLLYLLSVESINHKNIKMLIISSVVPSITVMFKRFSMRYLSIEPIIVDVGIKTGIILRFENPKEIGADRIVNAVAVDRYFGVPAIVVDFGTATTFDIINEKREYIGGVITPGIEIMAIALHLKTAKLPEVEISKIDTIVGKNTINSIKSGIYYGYLSMIDGIIDRIIDEQKFDTTILKVVATVGLGDIFLNDSKHMKIYDPYLTLNGLRLIYEKNN
jgi:type III pantothenate kinase